MAINSTSNGNSNSKLNIHINQNSSFFYKTTGTIISNRADNYQKKKNQSHIASAED